MGSVMASPTAPLPKADLERAFGLLTEADWRTLARRKVFLTGGTGFMGKWLLATLLFANDRLNLGCKVYVLSRRPGDFSTASPDIAKSSVIELIQGDVRNFRDSTRKFDTIIHAATDVVANSAPEEIFDTCIQGTRNILELAEATGATDFLLVSSGAVYGRQPPELVRVSETYRGAPDTLALTSAYGEGKRAAEWLGAAKAARSSLQVKIARCFAFVGPHLPLNKHFAIGNFIGSALRGEDIVIEGDGTPYRSYLYAADMAAWMWAILMRGRSGMAFNVGSEEAVSIANLAQQVNEATGGGSRIQLLRAPVIGRAPDRYVPDTVLARRELGLPDPMRLSEAIERTLTWHRKYSREQSQ